MAPHIGPVGGDCVPDNPLALATRARVVPDHVGLGRLQEQGSLHVSVYLSFGRGPEQYQPVRARCEAWRFESR